jgi:dephospho-CoA kinase
VLRVGLTGGLASGKSFVGATLRDLGCFLIQADRLGHAVLMPGGEAYEPVIEEFGRAILNGDGSINRRALAAEVFHDPERLRKLNALIHPPVFAREASLMAEFEHENPRGIAVVEAAILIETGSYKSYDRLIVAVCRPEQQIERAMRRDGITREAAMERLARQSPLEEKVKLADYVVDTSGTKENTVRQTHAVFDSLRSMTQ